MIELEIKNLRNVKDCSIALPFEEGVHAITGENGVGKSTIFSALAQLVSKKALQEFFKNDGHENTVIKYKFDGKENVWRKQRRWESLHNKEKEIILDGFFEGSLMFGSRFSDVHKFIKNKDYYPQDFELRNADPFIIKFLGKILRNDEEFYSGLKQIKTKKLAQKIHSFESQPYFIKRDGRWISQFFMSSGELLLIGLLNFIHEKIRRIQLKHNKDIRNRSLILIDEIELALHPSAQQRLLDFLNQISSDYDICIYIATHSIQIINHINSDRIYHIQGNDSGNLQVINPCYPAYATRSLYTNDGFDFIFLVEDELAKYIVNEIIQKLNLNSSKLIKILTCGGWQQVLIMHDELETSKLAGKACKIIAIPDGDIKNEYDKKCRRFARYSRLKKQYLPISSIEKFLKKQLIDSPDITFTKKLGDTYFKQKSINQILAGYKNSLNNESDKKKDQDGKRLFGELKRYAEEEGYTEEVFKNNICRFIYENTDISFESFENFLIGEFQ